MMKRMRILLGNRPQLMREVLREILAQQPDMEVVGEVVDPIELLVAAQAFKPDVVVVALQDSEEPGLCSHLLAEHPHLTILALTSEGAGAFIQQLCPRRQEIQELSAATLLQTIRQAIRDPGGWMDEGTHSSRADSNPRRDDLAGTS